MSNVRTQIGKVIGKSLNGYHSRVKPKIDELRFKEQYQGRIIDCMVGEVDDNYIETPLTDENVVKLEHSKEGVIKIPQIKGKTILIDADGNETDTPGEGCRLVSVGEEEDNKLIILSKNKNLCPDIYENRYITENGDFSDNSKNNILSDYIIVNQNTKYSGLVVQGDNSVSNGIFWSLYDSNKNFINRIYGNSITTTQETAYIRVHRSGLDSTTPPLHLQVNVGNIESVYTPHQSHKTEILLNEPLHKGNSIENNQLIKSFNKIFSDKEVWTKLNADLENTILFELYINDAKSSTSNHELSNITCNRFNTRGASNASGTWGTDIEGVSVNTNGRIHLRISKDRLTSLDINGLMEWFIENPTEILYELAEPIIEELPNGITLQGFDDTTMYIENSITPTVTYGYNALIPYKQELLNQKEEVETNTLDIEQNIIPYLMDMEFNLMLMEDN